MSTWNQQIITYVGTGVANTPVATTFALNVGVTTIWILGQLTSKSPVFRHSLMTGTIGPSTLSTTGGVMSFGATGFTVTDDLPHVISCNELGVNYTAVVINDTTGTFMQVGTYVGRAHIVTTCSFTSGSNLVLGGPFTTNDIGRTILIGPFSSVHQITGIWASGFIYDWNPLDDQAGALGVDAPAGASSVSGFLGTATQVWVTGRTGVPVFCSDDYTAPNSGYFEATEARPLGQQITFLASSGSFSIGTENNVNGGNVLYYYVVFTIPVGHPIRNIFQTYKAVGNGVSTVVALNFTPAFATARPLVTVIPESVWRGPLHAGATSRYFAGFNSSQGITAFGANSLTLGSLTGAAATEVYGFALKSSGSVTVIDETVTISGVTPSISVAEGRGLVITVPSAPTAAANTRNTWSLERFDFKPRNEDHKG